MYKSFLLIKNNYFFKTFFRNLINCVSDTYKNWYLFSEKYKRTEKEKEEKISST